MQPASGAAAARRPHNHQHFFATTAFIMGSSLVLLFASTAAAGKETPSSFILKFKATTPAIKDGVYQTFFATLNSSLVPSRTSGMFWGTMPQAAVASVCKYINDTGRYTIPSASISAYGLNNMPASITVNAITGCDAAAAAANSSALGVEAVVTETRDNRRMAVICHPQFISTYGCLVFITGSDITNIANKFKSNVGVRPTCNDNRADCTAWGASKCSDAVVGQTCPCMCKSGGSSSSSGVEFISLVDALACGLGVGGSVALGIAGALGCATLGPLAPVCWGLTIIGTAAVSVSACSGAIVDSCFPAHARVLLRDGSASRMDQLQLGQEVAVRQADGTLGFEPIYAWGHKERSSGPVRYVQIDLTAPSAAETAASGDAAAPSTAAQLELSPGHFVIMPCHRCRTSGAAAVTHKRANDVVPGDELWVAPALVRGGHTNQSSGEDGLGRLELWRVEAVRYIHAEGLYNPFTLGGTVIVEGVAASCHSDWLLDSAVDMLGLDAGVLPPVYQAAMSPLRMLWHLYGKEQYIRTYEQLDAAYNITSITSVKSMPSGTGRAAVLTNALQTALSTARLVVTGMTAAAWDVGVASNSVVGGKV
ncbi:hypothetical protein VaNZ11_003983 [Volvox africanus]|uniref:Hedgehog protein Hint domain-containing protein n=1 Tax=Volvox africanus TaxID=51714 RepID=A0ABQ5RVW4_9CHLO|nr:hypothetical protein VaNZ11_003982 [Volvox africanus]GLI61571.1 hypothetical protein VaNZ11_003983 [Volvox africanus]